MTPIRVVLADDHPIVLHGLELLFQSSPDFALLASCSDGAQALDTLRAQPTDVLVLDMRMPGLTGLDVMRTIRAEHLPCRVVVLTAALADGDAAEAVRLGARGIVLKESAPDTILECVRQVHQGELWIDGDAVSRAREAARHLTPREIEIVRMVAQGLRNKIVAERLSISEGTVKIHLHNIYEKLGVDGRLALVLLAQEKGLV